jgi:RNA polymerase sigma-70 factor (ECF subfamily)
VIKRPDPLSDPEPLVRRVYAFVAYRLGDGPDAEDVTSETFLRAVRYRETYDARKGDATAWLIGIARRCVAEALAQRASLATPPAAAPPVESAQFEDEVAGRISMDRALATLSERDRELVSLRYGADLTAKQIGSLLDLSTNAVEVALHRALDRLRAELPPGSAPRNATRARDVKPMRATERPR